MATLSNDINSFPENFKENAASLTSKYQFLIESLNRFLSEKLFICWTILRGFMRIPHISIESFINISFGANLVIKDFLPGGHCEVGMYYKGGGGMKKVFIFIFLFFAIIDRGCSGMRFFLSPGVTVDGWPLKKQNIKVCDGILNDSLFR